jgi:hypothetical protein
MRDTWSPLIVDDADLQSSLDSNHQKSPLSSSANKMDRLASSIKKPSAIFKSSES